MDRMGSGIGFPGTDAWEGPREFESPEVVAICDHLLLLGNSELEKKILWEARGVPLDLLVESLRCYSIKLCQIGIVSACTGFLQQAIPKVFGLAEECPKSNRHGGGVRSDVGGERPVGTDLKFTGVLSVRRARFQSVTRGFFFGVESDLGLRRSGRRSQERLEFLPDDAEGIVVPEELGIHLREFFQNFGLRHGRFALFDERPDDIHAHLDGLGTVEDVGSHEGAVFGEGVGKRATSTMGTGRNL